MAKSKDKGGKGKAGKLPKRIAGVKVPKELRKPGAKVVDVLNHPLIADVAAAALLAAAAALRNEKTVRSLASKVGYDAGKGARDLRDEAATLASFVAGAAEAGIRQLKSLNEASSSAGAGGKRKKAR